MKHIKNLIISLLIAASLLCPACGTNADDTSQNITTAGQAEKIEQTVYWVKTGKVWHKSRECRTLARSSNIYQGTVKESGKSRVCKVCG